MKITYSDIQKRIRKRKIKFRIFLIIVTILIIIGYILKNPIFKVNNIVVNGNSIVSSDKITELSGIKVGDNILKLDIRKINKSILGDPNIEKSKIKRMISGNVYIIIEERKHACIVQYKNKYIIMDKIGTIINILDKHDEINIPIISGLKVVDAVPGKIIKLEDESQLYALKIILDSITTSSLSDIIDEVDIENFLSILIKTKYNINIKIGTIDNIDKKINISKAIIEQDLKNKKLKGTIDVSFNGNPVFMQE